LSHKRQPNEETKLLIYTLGTSTRTLEEFLEILQLKGITRICDVRSFPGSRRYPHFSKDALAASLEQAGIGYFWLGQKLGGFRKGGYETWMQTPEGAAGLLELEEIASQAPTAIICAELVPWRCHRRFIAFALEDRGWEVIHILDASRDWKFTRERENLQLEGTDSA